MAILIVRKGAKPPRVSGNCATCTLWVARPLTRCLEKRDLRHCKKHGVWTPPDGTCRGYRPQ